MTIEMNFQDRFVSPINDGTKKITIRKQGKKHSIGCELHLYKSLKTKQRKLIKKTHCILLCKISISKPDRKLTFLDVYNFITFACKNKMNRDSEASFLKCEGFSNMNEFYDFIDETYGLPFEGVLIAWE